MYCRKCLYVSSEINDTGFIVSWILCYNPVLIYIKILIYPYMYLQFFSSKYFMRLKSTIILGNGFHIQSLYNAVKHIHESSLVNLAFPLVLLYFFLLLDKDRRLSQKHI